MRLGGARAGVQESFERLKQMVKERGIEPCPRIYTESCLYDDPFPDPETDPITYTVCLLQRCNRCIFRVLEKIERHTCDVAVTEKSYKINPRKRNICD